MILHQLKQSPVIFNGETLSGEGVGTSVRTLGDIREIFLDKAALSQMDLNRVAYQVASYEPMKQGTRGGIYMGITYLEAGKVGNEYFMTKGHFHNNDESVEYYCKRQETEKLLVCFLIFLGQLLPVCYNCSVPTRTGPASVVLFTEKSAFVQSL